MQPPASGNLVELAALWLDGAPASESDLRAASSLAMRVAGFDGLRPFSAPLEQLLALVGNLDFDVADARKLIELDPALSARVLRVANSVAFRGVGPCASVTQALVRIGARNISGVAMAMSAMALFHDLGGVGQRIRDHSAGTAVVGRELAVSFGQPGLSSKVFLAGLLHDIGKLLMIQTGDRAYAELAAQNPSPSSLHLKEQALWGFDHGILGAQVLRSWNIPDPVPKLVALHHQPKVGQGNELAPALDLLRLADVVDWLLGQGCDADSPWVERLSESPDGVRVGLGRDTLASLWRDLGAARSEALHIFT